MYQAGFTPLHVACHFGQLNMVRFITARQGVKINAATASGYTPLHQAAQQGHSTIVSHLLDKGADPNVLTSVSKKNRKILLFLLLINGNIDRLLERAV